MITGYVSTVRFTSLCPITGQPVLKFVSVPAGCEDGESKSLKLYLFSFRNHGDFREDCEHHHERTWFKLMDPNTLG